MSTLGSIWIFRGNNFQYSSLFLLIFTSRFLINALKLQPPDYPVLYQFLIREDVDWAFLGHPSPPLSFPLSSPKQLPHHFWTENWAQFPPNSQQEKWVLSTAITRNRFCHQLVSLSRDPGRLQSWLMFQAGETLRGVPYSPVPGHLTHKNCDVIICIVLSH